MSSINRLHNMKAIPHLLYALGVLTFGFRSIQAADTNQTNFRLTIDLQDGSKLVGQAGDENYQFRPDGLSEMELPLERIRSME
jgi:hypothetical protein